MAIAVVEGFSIRAIASVVGGIRVVIASRAVRATRYFKLVADAISVVVVDTLVVAVIWERGIGARAIVVVGTWVVVARFCIRTAKHQTRREVARFVFKRGVGVVIARKINHATVDVVGVANVVVIFVGFAITPTFAEGIVKQA